MPRFKFSDTDKGGAHLANMKQKALIDAEADETDLPGARLQVLPSNDARPIKILTAADADATEEGDDVDAEHGVSEAYEHDEREDAIGGMPSFGRRPLISPGSTGAGSGRSSGGNTPVHANQANSRGSGVNNNMMMMTFQDDDPYSHLTKEQLIAMVKQKESRISSLKAGSYTSGTETPMARMNRARQQERRESGLSPPGALQSMEFQAGSAQHSRPYTPTGEMTPNTQIKVRKILDKKKMSALFYGDGDTFNKLQRDEQKQGQEDMLDLGILSPEEVGVEGDEGGRFQKWVELKFRLHKLKLEQGAFSKKTKALNPYVEVSRWREHMWEKVVRTEVVHHDCDPVFQPIVVRLQTLSVGSLDRPIMFRVWSHNLHTHWNKPHFIGEHETTLRQILQHVEYKERQLDEAAARDILMHEALENDNVEVPPPLPDVTVEDDPANAPLVDPARHTKAKMKGRSYRCPGYIGFSAAEACLLTSRQVTLSNQIYFENEARFLKLSFSACNLPRLHNITHASPYVEFYGLHEKAWKKVYVSEVIKNRATARFHSVSMDAFVVCSGYYDRPILIKVWSSNGKQDGRDDVFIGSMTTSVKEVLSTVGNPFVLSRDTVNENRLLAYVNRKFESRKRSNNASVDFRQSPLANFRFRGMNESMDMSGTLQGSVAESPQLDAEPAPEDTEYLEVVMRGLQLVKSGKRLQAAPSTYVCIYRSAHGHWELVAQSERAPRTHDPSYAPVMLHVNSLVSDDILSSIANAEQRNANGVDDADDADDDGFKKDDLAQLLQDREESLIMIKVLHHNERLAPDLIGQFTLTIAELRQTAGTKHNLINPNILDGTDPRAKQYRRTGYKHSGRLQFDTVESTVQPEIIQRRIEDQAHNLSQQNTFFVFHIAQLFTPLGRMQPAFMADVVPSSATIKMNEEDWKMRAKVERYAARLEERKTRRFVRFTFKAEGLSWNTQETEEKIGTYLVLLRRRGGKWKMVSRTEHSVGKKVARNPKWLGMVVKEKRLFDDAVHGEAALDPKNHTVKIVVMLWNRDNSRRLKVGECECTIHDLLLPMEDGTALENREKQRKKKKALFGLSMATPPLCQFTLLNRDKQKAGLLQLTDVEEVLKSLREKQLAVQHEEEEHKVSREQLLA